VITIKFDTAALQANLEKFADEVVDKALRPAAFAASKVIYSELNLRVPVKTGRLKSALYQYHNEKQSVNGAQVYSIGVNKKKAPHWHFAELGTKRTPAKPFIAPTYDAKIVEAMDAARKRLGEKLEDIKNGRS
jgi:HK97 gp10 family phage protein